MTDRNILLIFGPNMKRKGIKNFRTVEFASLFCIYYFWFVLDRIDLAMRLPLYARGTNPYACARPKPEI